MSLEQHDCIKDVYINQNYNILSILCKAYIKFETVFGKINNRFFKGEISNKLINKEEMNKKFDENNDFLASFIIDRNIDFIILFCTSNTYESLLDEKFGINFNSFKVPSSILIRKDSKREITKIDLSNKNKIYSYIKNYSYESLNVFHKKNLEIMIIFLIKVKIKVI